MSGISYEEDTISGIATPPGIGGLAVVRISGSKSLDIVKNCIDYPGDLTPHKATYTHFKDPGKSEIIDEVIVVYFQSPKSYTAEDVIEISCHGGHFVAERILKTLIKHGVRLSEPGEFTKRAYLNGRIDLTQAEAVGDIIAAQTESSHKIALQQLQGALKEKVFQIRQSLMDTVSILELELDFAEEEINKTSFNQIESSILAIKEDCQQLIDSYRNGKLYRRGILAPIVGKPNAGKSSILNALLKEERALVSEIPGTTRDTLEESISHNGVEIRLVDTAGLRSSLDSIESMGISRAEDIMKQADILLHVIDVTEPVDKIEHNSSPVLKIFNKIDLLPDQPSTLNTIPGNKTEVYTSAIEMDGIPEIGDHILDMVFSGRSQEEVSENVTITNKRHKNAIESTIDSLDKALETVNQQLSPEFIVVDLRGALDSLGLLTGQTTTDDILNNIFANFCIGK